MNKYIQETKMIDYYNPIIRKLVLERKWKEENEFYKIQKIYNFVRDEIKFGYNSDDSIPASKVLKDGYGQCNTKGTLFMALLRAVNIPCRLHGFTINKALQKGTMTGLIYTLAPMNVVHSWVEVFYQDKWYNLEAFIIDKEYLQKLQDIHSDCIGDFCGYGVAVSDFRNPIIDWNVNDTYIQKEGINQDFGIYDAPDDFFAEHSQQMNFIKKLFFKSVGRHLMNYNVTKIREK